MYMTTMACSQYTWHTCAHVNGCTGSKAQWHRSLAAWQPSPPSMLYFAAW